MNAPVRQPAIFTDDEFEAMSRAGAFEQVGRVELRDGVIVRMSPIHLPHARARMHMTQALMAALAAADSRLELTDEVTIRFGGGFRPTAHIVIWEPPGDVAEMTGPLPGAAARLVVEVSDASIGDDLGDKLSAYPRARVPEYWVVDIKARVIFRHSEPLEDHYRWRKAVSFGGPAASLTLDGVIADTAVLAG